MSSLPLSYVEKKTKNVCFQPHTTEEVKRRFVSQWKTSVNYNSFCINWHLISSTNKKKEEKHYLDLVGARPVVRLFPRLVPLAKNLGDGEKSHQDGQEQKLHDVLIGEKKSLSA